MLKLRPLLSRMDNRSFNWNPISFTDIYHYVDYRVSAQICACYYLLHCLPYQGEYHAPSNNLKMK